MRPVLIVPMFLLTACVETKPIVSDYNGHIVKVQFHPYALGDDYKGSPIYETARDTCGREAVYQGVRQIDPYTGEHVFLCR